jgi:hypothetical protein
MDLSHLTCLVCKQQIYKNDEGDWQCDCVSVDPRYVEAGIMDLPHEWVEGLEEDLGDNGPLHH